MPIRPAGAQRVVAIVQARMGSTRLPGKVMRPLLGQPMLAQILHRLGQATRVDALLVATSTHAADDAIADLAAAVGVDCFRGSEQDVLSRFVGAARRADADLVVRITADCPFVDPQVVDHLLVEHLLAGADYTSNTLERTYPHGADVEVFSRTVLETAAAEAAGDWEREHVTPFIWSRPERYRLHQVRAGPELQHPEYRLTVDTEEDYMLARAVYETLGHPDFGLAEVIALLERQPWLPYINRHVAQKPVITEPDPERALALECLYAGRWARQQGLHRAAALLAERAARSGFRAE